MWNGFFKTDHLTEEEVKSMMHKALELSYDHHIDILKSIERKRYGKISGEDFIDEYINSESINIAIDRRAYHPMYDHGEMGARIDAGGYDLFLFMYLDLDDFYDLVEEYNLPKRV